jgi:hypothetical protein
MAAEIDSSFNFREDRAVNGNFGKVKSIEGGRVTIGVKKTHLSEFERTEPENDTLK